MKWKISALALATASFVAAPAAAQLGTSNSTAATLHVADDTAGCINRRHALEERMKSCETTIKEGHFTFVLQLATLQRIAGRYDASLASIARYTDRLPDIPTTYASTNSKDWIVALQVRGETYAQMGRFEDA